MRPERSAGYAILIVALLAPANSSVFSIFYGIIGGGIAPVSPNPHGLTPRRPPD